MLLQQTREQRYLSSLGKARRYFDLRRSLALSPEDDAVLVGAINDTLPTLLHPLMFVPNILALCTDAQQAEWLPRCASLQVKQQ
jgi:acyl-CoA oxidase